MTLTATAAPIPGAATTSFAIASLFDPTPALTITPILDPQDGVPDPRSRTFWSAVAVRSAAMPMRWGVSRYGTPLIIRRQV